MTPWYDLPKIERRASQTETGIDGRVFRKGEFMPFYVPRPEMPQIDESDLERFIDFALLQGVGITHAKRCPTTLRAHQRIDLDHALNMPPEVAAKPVVVSADGYVLDGNHRWFFHARQGTDLNVIEVDLPFEEAIRLMFAYPATYVLTPSTPVRN